MRKFGQLQPGTAGALPRRLRAPSSIAVLGVAACLLVAAMSGRSAAVEQTGRLEATTAFQAQLGEDPHQAMQTFHDLLAASRLEEPGTFRWLDSLAVSYRDATGDSTLIADLRFAKGLTPAQRSIWRRALQHDAEAFELRGERDFEASMRVFRQAIAEYQQVGDLRREAIARGSLGVSAWYAADWDAAREAYEGALRARMALGDSVLIGRSLNALGSVANLQGRFEEALDYYQRALLVRQHVGNPADIATTLTYLGNVHYNLGNLEQAERYYRRGLALFPDDSPRKLEASENLANVLASLGEHDAAVKLYRDVEDQLVAAERWWDVARIQQNLAQSLLESGDYAAALRELLSSRALADSLEDAYIAAATWNVLGALYLQLGELDREVEAFARAESLAIQSERYDIAADAKSNLGKAYLQRHELDKAFSKVEEAMAYRRSVLESEDWSSDLLTLGDIRSAEGRHGEALTYYQQALENARENLPRAETARFHVNVGNAYNALGRLEAGREEFRQALRLARASGQREVEWRALLGLADGFEIAGELDSARARYDEAIEAVESLYGASLSEVAKASYVGARAFVYEAQVHVLAKLFDRTQDARYAREAFHVSERGKARALRDLLYESHLADPLAGVEPRLLEDKARYDRQLSELQYKLRSLGRQGSDAQRDSLERRRAALLEARGTLAQRIRLEAADTVQWQAARPATVGALQRTLLSNESAVLLAYSIGDSASYLWVITRKDCRLHRLPGRRTLERAVQDYRRLLEDPTGSLEVASRRGLGLVRSTYGDPGTQGSPSEDLYELLLRPAAQTLRSAPAVYVVPDGVLHYLPFEALRAPAAASEGGDRTPTPKAYALAGKAVSYGPSGTTLLFLAKQEHAAGSRKMGMDFLGLGDPSFSPGEHAPLEPKPGTGAAGDLTVASLMPRHVRTRSEIVPLPSTREEVLEIRELFPPERATLLLGSEASEERLKALDLSRYRMLHFATHGVIDERHPMRSSLVCAFPQSPQEDGFLEAAEIYELEFDADLVVLSACETGLGKRVRGEGVLGLPRAFLFAGARSVLVSLWSVSDVSTSLFMQAFYRNLVAEGMPPARALEAAREALRRQPEFSHPYYWSPFVFVGAQP